MLRMNVVNGLLDIHAVLYEVDIKVQKREIRISNLLRLTIPAFWTVERVSIIPVCDPVFPN